MKVISLFPCCIGASLIFGGCMVGPDFAGAPAQSLPATWANRVPPATDSENLVQWWRQFGDRQLTRLIETGFAANPDMIAAALSIKEAESSAKIAGASLLPVVTAGASQATAPAGAWNSTAHGEWGMRANASWEIDIFGGNRRKIEAALASLHATQAAAGSVQTALAANIAATYFDWIAANENLRIAREQLAYQKHTLNIVQRRYDAGMEAKLALEQALTQVASTESGIPAQEALVKEAENTLAVYLGTHMAQVRPSMPSAFVAAVIPRVPTGLPSELLRRRPDIIQAEAKLHGVTTEVGVAVAELFPKLSLTGSANTAAGSDFAGFYSARQSGWSLGGGITQNIFRGGALLEQIKLRKTSVLRVEEAYRKTVIAALSEVESCLVSYARLMRQLPLQQEMVRSTGESARLSLKLYSAGYTDFLNVASAQQSWLSSQQKLTTMRQSIRQNLANLYKVLGGGWDGSRVAGV